MKPIPFRTLALTVALLGVVRPLRAADVLTSGEARYVANVRQLTYEGKRSGEAYFSPDGKLLIFSSEREKDNPFYQIYILDLETGDTHRVSPGTGKTTCPFFRPGTDEVLFSSTHLDPEALAKQKKEFEDRATGKQRRYAWDYDTAMDIFSARRDGTGLKRLTDAEGYDAEAAYSPDGSKIVFCSTRSAYPSDKLSAEDKKRLEMDPSYFGEIYLMDADGKNVKRLTDWPGYDGGPFFTPDGEHIVWRHFEESGALADVYTMRLDGTDRKRLTDFKAMSWAPYFHPSGRYVLFASNKLGFSNFELYLVDAEGKHEPVQVTFTDGFDGLPAFSDDGKRLCWTSNRTSDGASQLFLADWNDEAARQALEAAPVRDEAGKAPQEAAAPAAPAPAAAGADGAIRAADLKDAVGLLAADRLEGRLTGSDGARQAADWIAAQLKEAGLEPGADGGQYFQEFPFTAGMEVVKGQNHLEIAREGKAPQSFEVDQDFRPLSFSTNGEARGQVVFAGYGLDVPKSEGAAYDSYAGLDVKDKIVLVLRYAPEDVDMKRRTQLNHYAGLRYKAMQARERGAKALLVVTGPTSPNAGELAKLDFDTSLSGSGLVAASISGKTAEALLAGTGKDLKTLQAALDIENPHAEGGFAIPGVEVHLTAALNRIKKTDHNVLGLVPASGDAAKAEVVVVGAHYDHLGRGQSGNSLAHKGEENEIHNGADDNASGTATVIALARAVAAEKRAHPEEFRRSVLFALWSGEELGLVGSAHFAEQPPAAAPLARIAAYVNFDMVGRLKDNKLIVQGVGSSPAWRPILEKRNVAAGFNLVLQDDPYLPTDVTALYPKKVPVLNFFTGSHEDYHRPTDDPDKLDYAGMERIARLARALILDVAKSEERPAYAEVKDTRGQGGDRDALRAYLGTIPDYTTEGLEGVKLSGVRGGGPADKGGLKGGDVIVEFGGKKITNIYDYTYALDAVKIGVPIQIVVLRNGQRVTLTVTPEARK
jgi:Tol biopolymer transport system component